MVEEVGGGATEGEPLPLVKVLLGSGSGIQHSSQGTVQCCLCLLLDGTEVGGLSHTHTHDIELSFVHIYSSHTQTHPH